MQEISISYTSLLHGEYVHEYIEIDLDNWLDLISTALLKFEIKDLYIHK